MRIAITLGVTIVSCLLAGLLGVVLGGLIAQADAEWDGERWRDERGNVWLDDREVWWNPPTGLYYVGGFWRDGAGRYWDGNGWRWPVIDLVSSHRTPGVEHWRQLVMSIFGAARADAVLAIMRCESNGDPWATGAQGEVGLMQIHPRYHADATYDPEGNLRAAYRISRGGADWSAWSCRRALR
jgi:hypothetical protein